MMSVMRRVAAMGIVLLSLVSCGRDRSSLVGTHSFSGQMEMTINNCTVPNPPKGWTTVFKVTAAPDPEHYSITEEAYGCTVLATRRENVLDASGLSCSVNGFGFYRQDFKSFVWDVAAKKLEYSSTLSANDANNEPITYCAHVSGDIN